ncbi:MAG: ArsR/SmtB family transcription factor [Haloferacaceae archaeon]
MPTIEQLSPDRTADPAPEPRVLSLDEAGPMVDALTSETARAVVLALDREPATATAVADRIGSSLQNVSHHLSNLQDAGLVAAVGTRYSEKGQEMTVYAPAVSSLVIGDPGTGDERS